ncbi:MAG TPA: alpha/beta hydrolase [Candidatus Limnocylindria bacterium]|nr:alpha/beta hydrolase [Candidatus Limnocylindria bacterium]
MTQPRSITTPDGRSLDVWLAGPADADPLVFHMGTPSSGMPFDPHVEALAERGLRYISWSRPGYGTSSRDEGRSVADVVGDTRAVLDHLGLDEAWILGWSGGGPHALACAALMPERVRGTALIAGVAPYPAEGLDWLAGMGDENIEEFEAALAGPAALIPFKERNRPVFMNLTAADVADALGDLIDDVDRGSLAGDLGEYMATSSRECLSGSYWGWFDDDMAIIKPWGFDLGSIPGRVHVWQGAHDRMVPFAHGQWLAEHVGNACPHLVPEHGHLSLVVDDFPAIVDELITGAA